MAKIQYDGIKYPFENKNNENYLFDLNTTMRESIRSRLLHVIFTPKGQKVRDPEFGTDLIRHIFEQNDTQTWSKMTEEISSAVSKYVPDTVVNSIKILQNEEDSSVVFVRIDYSVKEGNLVTNDTVITKI